MKKNIFKLLVCGTAILAMLTGCGSSFKYSSSSMAMDAGNSMDSATVNSSTFYTSNTDAAYFDSLKMNSDMADYSYTYEATGPVKSKEEALEVYKSVEKYIEDKDAYIENLNNSFRVDENNNDTNYSASGVVRFTVQVKEEDVEGVIDLLNKYCDDNGLRVSVYNQSVKNYDKYEIVDTDEVKGKSVITRDELLKCLSYSDISVRISYHIDRPFYEKIGIGIKNIFTSIFDIYEDLIISIIGVVVVAFVIVYVVIAGTGMYTKALYKRRLKHPEWYPAKEVKIVNNDEVKKIEDKKGEE